MTPRPDPLEERFEHLLREQVSSGAPDAMSGLVKDLRKAYATPLPMEVQNRQIAEMVAAGRHAAAHRPPVWRCRIDDAWFRFSRRFIAGSVVGKVVLAASVATAATTGMAATGHLPDPMQIALSAAASHVGVSIPTPAAPQPAEPSLSPSPPAARQVPVAKAPVAGSPVTTPLPPRGSAQVQAAPSPVPTDPCASTILASPPPNGDVLEAVKKLTGDQKALEQLLACLVPTPAAPQPPGAAPAPGSTDALAKLLNDLLGVKGP